MNNAKIEHKDLFWYIILRLIVVTTLLVAVVIIQFSGAGVFPVLSLLRLILAAFLASAVFLALFFLKAPSTLQAYLQIFFDLALVTAFVYISGGIKTSTYFLYVFVIIGASLVISKRAAFLAAALSAILFGILVDGMHFGIIPYFSPEHAMKQSLGTILYTMIIAWVTFFVIAFLTNYLSASLKRTRAELQSAQKELILRERLAEAGRVSATLAHEIRNPLAAISGSVQVLKNELSLDGSQKELMDIVLKESDRVSQSIEQFLDFASPAKTIFTDVDLSGVLDETLKMIWGSDPEAARIRLEGNYARSHVPFFANPGQIKQIFWNLAKNAVRAMPEGGTLTVNLENGTTSVGIRFRDTGIGMTEEDRAHLFEPFYSGFGDGRGLGMANVRRIVDDYEGRIIVSSEIKRGTEIFISLPRKKTR